MLKSCILLFITFILLILFVANTVFSNEKQFQLSVIHINDFHSRFEETNVNSGTCKNSDICIGGFSRIYSAIKNLVSARRNPIVLNAGDNFQGTLWYNMYKWNVTQHFFNKLPMDAYTLGNHDFGDKIEGVIPFIKSLNAPVVVANIDDSEEPSFKNICKKSVIITRLGKRIGIIGVITSNTNLLAITGKLKFLDASESVNKEARRLVAEEQVDTIIVVSHCGYDIDQEIARKAAPKIGLIVGGHSHTFLYTGNGTFDSLIPEGPYPTIVDHNDGRKILVVQASVAARIVGDIVVQYDSNGDVISWEGAPIYLNRNVPQDLEVNKEIGLWKEAVDKYGNTVVGNSLTFLDSSTCHYDECILGDVITDAMVYAYSDTEEKDAWTNATVAIINSGGIRAPIERGDITFNDVMTSMPFEDSINIAEIEGKYLKEALEFSTSFFDPYRNKLDLKFLQVSGIQVVFNISKPYGYRVISVKVLCRKCLIPEYEELNPNETYRIVLNSYLVRGGNGFFALSNNLKNQRKGERDSEMLKRYLKAKSPLVQSLEGRIRVID